VQELGGSTDRQTDRLVSGNIPYHRHHTHFVYGSWPGAGRLSALLIFMSSNPLLSRECLNFFRNLAKLTISGFCDCYLETDCESFVGWCEKLYCV